MSGTNVIYRKTPGQKPTVEYYSMPTSCIGGADTVAEATQRFGEALADALDVDTPPRFSEHTEIEAREGVYVRMALDDEMDHRTVGLNATLAAMRKIPDDAFEEFTSAEAASGDVIFVVAQPHDTFGFVFDQMTAYDSVWLAMNFDGDSIRFLSIRGSHAGGNVADTAQEITSEEYRDQPLKDFAEAAFSEQAGAAAQLVLA